MRCPSAMHSCVEQHKSASVIWKLLKCSQDCSLGSIGALCYQKHLLFFPWECQGLIRLMGTVNPYCLGATASTATPSSYQLVILERELFLVER